MDSHKSSRFPFVRIFKRLGKNAQLIFSEIDNALRVRGGIPFPILILDATTLALTGMIETRINRIRMEEVVDGKEIG